MERLMMLRLHAHGCAAEAHLNGLCVARLGPAGGVVTLPVHEYTLAGRNRISFVAGPTPVVGEAPPPQPRMSRGDLVISVKLALCHQGQSPEDPNARVLSQMSWSPGVNEKHDWPFTFAQDVELPVTFPRWRWLDAPVIQQGDALNRQVLEFLQTLAVDFQRGDAEPYLLAAKLRTEELALAYQRAPNAWAQSMREHIQQLFEAQAQALATVMPPDPGSFVLRSLVQGRLVEPVMPDGSPVLKTAPATDPLKSQVSWPLRLAQVEGKLYILR